MSVKDSAQDAITMTNLLVAQYATRFSIDRCKIDINIEQLSNQYRDEPLPIWSIFCPIIQLQHVHAITRARIRTRKKNKSIDTLTKLDPTKFAAIPIEESMYTHWAPCT